METTGFFASIPLWFYVPASIVGICSAVTSFFPSQHSNSFAQWLLDAGNFVGFNWMKNKNKDDARP